MKCSAMAAKAGPSAAASTSSRWHTCRDTADRLRCIIQQSRSSEVVTKQPQHCANLQDTCQDVTGCLQQA